MSRQLILPPLNSNITDFWDMGHHSQVSGSCCQFAGDSQDFWERWEVCNSTVPITASATVGQDKSPPSSSCPQCMILCLQSRTVHLWGVRLAHPVMVCIWQTPVPRIPFVHFLFPILLPTCFCSFVYLDSFIVPGCVLFPWLLWPCSTQQFLVRLSLFILILPRLFYPWLCLTFLFTILSSPFAWFCAFWPLLVFILYLSPSHFQLSPAVFCSSCGSQH